LLTAAERDSLSYPQVGLIERPPPGFRLDRWTRTLGTTEQAFDAAREALRSWQVHRGAGLAVCADGPPTVGANVAMSAPLPVGHVDAVCRVVAVEDTSGRFGFTYGTLSEHPERGEERFTVLRAADSHVEFEIVAVSQPQHPLARAFGPIARRLQQSATERYLDAMTSATSAA
jgi:uncharacterized protein (UPF0548 family)